MRKIVVSLLFFTAISLSAQELENVFLLDLGYIYSPYEYSKEGWGAGVKYERAVSSGLSIGLGVGGMAFTQTGGDYFKLDIRPEFRFYLGADAPAGLFIGVSPGYTLAGVGEERFHFPVINASAGYKFLFGYFAIDAGLGYTFFFNLDNLWKPSTETKAKILLGFAF